MKVRFKQWNCDVILAKYNNERIAIQLVEEGEPLYDSGFPGLVYCCYSITKNK